MYLYGQGRTSGVSLGIGRLDAFGKSREKKTEPDPVKARQLEEQMKTLAAKARELDEKGTEGATPMGFWNGVNRTYENWLKVSNENDSTKWPIHKMAAEAAKKMGDAISRYRRVVRALVLLKRAGSPAEERTQLKTEKKDLDDNWARVDIRLMRRLTSPLIYPVPPSWIARGDGRAAFKWASEELSERRKFNGLLPVGQIGRFSIDGQEISLEPDCALLRTSVVRVVQKGDGTFKIDCIPRPPTAEPNPPTLID